MTDLTLLSPIELASGIVSGSTAGFAAKLPRTFDAPLIVLEDILADALAGGSCFVSFTGGRDSSAMLAVAVRVARERALPPPIPVTMVFPSVSSSDETSWQTLLLKHLKLDANSWERIVVKEGELDLIGASAADLIARHGLLYPPNVLLALPIVNRIGDSTVVTGIEGDGLLGGWRHAYFSDVLRRNRPVRIRELSQELYQFAPLSVRRTVVRSRALQMPWLTTAGYEQFATAWADEKITAPRTWDKWVEWWSHRRYLDLIKDGFDRVAADYGTKAVHPLLDGRFLGSLACHGGKMGYGDRRQLMHAIFGADLPPELLNRTTKAATFSELVWSNKTKAFAASWDGRGVDERVVDVDSLRAIWRGDSPASVPDELTSLLLQSVWLSRQNQ